MIDEIELQRFADILINSYKGNSILTEIGNVKYSKDEGKFFQIGHRTLIPMEFFVAGNNVENGFIAEDYGWSIALGEINFIINQMTELAKSDEIKFVKIKNFSYAEIADAIMNVNEPTDIFIPIDAPYFNGVHNWLYTRGAEYVDRDLYIIVANFKVKVHWSNKYIPLDRIIVLNKKGINFLQKKFEDIKIPKELDKILYSFKEGEPLRLDFAQSKEEDKFDFYFRSVIAFENVNKESAIVIELPKDENKEKSK